MKFRLFASIFVLAVSLVATAQDAPATSAAPNSTPAPQTKACCHHNMSDMKDGESCCHHAAADARDDHSCCGKDKCEMKDGKSCCAGKDRKAAMKECKKNGCCKDGKSCGNASDDKTAMGCCGTKCEHHPQASAGS
ncbi:MAG: hypothetical protein WAK29_16445 [Terriglobales bacterium]